MSEIINIAKPTKEAIREIAEQEKITRRGLIDAFINIDTGECAGIFWRNDGYSWYENEPENTYMVSIPARTELDETGEDWEEELKDNIDRAIDRLIEKIEKQRCSRRRKWSAPSSVG
jgi:predicted RNase H-like HicB family nuclease